MRYGIFGFPHKDPVFWYAIETDEYGQPMLEGRFRSHPYGWMGCRRTDVEKCHKDAQAEIELREWLRERRERGENWPEVQLDPERRARSLARRRAA